MPGVAGRVRDPEAQLRHAARRSRSRGRSSPLRSSRIAVSAPAAPPPTITTRIAVEGAGVDAGRPRRPRRTRMIPRMLLAIDIGNTNVTLGLVADGALVDGAGGRDAPRGHGGRAGGPARAACSALDGRASPTSRRIARRVGRPRADRHDRGRRRPPRDPDPRRGGRERADRRPGGPAGRGGRRPARQRARGGPPPRHAGHRRATSGPRRRSTASARTARSSAARSRPGLELGLEALAARTAKLPRVELRTPDRAIGRDTVERDPDAARCSATRRWRRGCSRGSAPSSRRPPGIDARGRPRDPDRRPVRRAVGARRRGRGRHRPGPHAQGPRDPPRGGRGRGEPMEAGRR